MDQKQKYILMFKNDEVLSFEATFGQKNYIRFIEKLAHFDKAPFGIATASEEDIGRLVTRFIYLRSINQNRWDYDLIMKYTGYKNDFDLSFAGHGLSLSNHYWYKKEDEDLRYEDINFFTNKWDDSFARAVLSENYEALKDVDLNVPDIVTPGWAVKGWLCEEDGKRLYKLGIDKGHPEESLTEVLVSKLAKRLFKDEESVEYELKEIYGKYASASKVMIGVDEELVPLSSVLPSEINDLYRKKNKDHRCADEFYEKVAEFGLPGLKEFFVKLTVLRSLCFINDLHFFNISVIRNLKTKQIRIAPLFDLASAFGSTKGGREQLSHISKATYMMIFFLYGNLKEDWDYSWYNPKSLDGFEDEIREYLSKSEFYTPSLIDNIIEVYRYQKASLDEIASKNKGV